VPDIDSHSLPVARNAPYMPIVIANAAQVREMDRLMADQYAYPTLLLMEAAGRKSADKLLQLYQDVAHFLVLCGPGNNGGDGLSIARHLRLAGRDVWCLLADDPDRYQGDAALQYRMAERQGLRIEVYSTDLNAKIQNYLVESTIMVDALLGTGQRGQVKEPVKSVIDAVRQYPNAKVAIDLPSGLLADTGAVLSAPLKCEHTLTLQVPKYCHYISPASIFCGQVHVLDIGIYPDAVAAVATTAHLITDSLIRQWYRARAADSHKGTFGHVLLAGGSKGKAGSIALSTQSATEIGAGLCTAFIPASIACAFHRTTLENMSVPYGALHTAILNETAASVFGSYLEDKKAVAIGPGLGHNQDTHDFLREVLPLVTQPLVLDADALNIVAEDPALWASIKAPTIITPHPGEMARLLGVQASDVQAQRAEAALKLATERQVIVVLKGAGTVIATPEGRIYVCHAGNPGMATGGTGDVLAGAIAGLLAQDYDPIRASVMAVHIHARSGDRVARTHGLEGVTAAKIMRYLGSTLKEILEAVRHGHSED